MSRSGSYKIQHSQNYLVNKKLVRRLVEDAGFTSSETVVEIGPGKGIITRELARQAGHVIGIEYDHGLVAQLARSLPENVTLIQADAVQFPLPATPYRVFANIPFRHTAAIVGKLTSGTAPPVESRLIVQREAAERFMLNAESTMKAHQLAPFFDTEVLHAFDPADFRPSPGVETVLFQVRLKSRPELELQHRRLYGMFVDVAYSSWQPTLEASLKTSLPRLAAQDVIGTPDIKPWLRLNVSRIPTNAWIAIFMQLLARDDDRVWHEIQRSSARNQTNRGKLDRPNRTRTKTSRRRS